MTMDNTLVKAFLKMKKAKTQYIGTFKKGAMTGIGKLLFPDGSSLSGSFKDGLLSGPGTFLSKDGTKMEGNFEDNAMSGLGREFYPDGKPFFEGSYKDGLREGKGTMFFTEEKARIEGIWIEGVLEGKKNFQILIFMLTFKKVNLLIFILMVQQSKEFGKMVN